MPGHPHHFVVLRQMHTCGVDADIILVQVPSDLPCVPALLEDVSVENVHLAPTKVSVLWAATTDLCLGVVGDGLAVLLVSHLGVHLAPLRGRLLAVQHPQALHEVGVLRAHGVCVFVVASDVMEILPEACDATTSAFEKLVLQHLEPPVEGLRDVYKKVAPDEIAPVDVHEDVLFGDHV